MRIAFCCARSSKVHLLKVLYGTWYSFRNSFRIQRIKCEIHSAKTHRVKGYLGCDISKVRIPPCVRRGKGYSFTMIAPLMDEILDVTKRIQMSEDAQ